MRQREGGREGGMDGRRDGGKERESVAYLFTLPDSLVHSKEPCRHNYIVIVIQESQHNATHMGKTSNMQTQYQQCSRHSGLLVAHQTVVVAAVQSAEWWERRRE